MGYFLAGLFGASVGLFELWSRYKSFPLKHLYSFLYITFNFLASSVAFYVIVCLNIGFKLCDGILFSQVIIAGFSAMFVLRSSFAEIKVHGHTTSVGLATILQGFLTLVDRECDRILAKEINKKLNIIMDKVDFEKAKSRLTLLCIILMQNLSLDEQQKLKDQVEKVSHVKELDNKSKSLVLGGIINSFTGLDLLKEAINSLGDSITLGDSIALSDLDKQINDLLLNL